MAQFADTFNRADTASGAGLGVTSTGGAPWVIVAGTWQIASQRAQATAPSPVPIAVLATSGPNASMSIDGYGGAALYARVVDVNNWVRARVNYFSQSSSYPYSYTVYNWGASFNRRDGGSSGRFHASVTYSGQPSAAEFGVDTSVYYSNPSSASVESTSQQTGYSSSTSYFRQAVVETCVAGSVTQVASTPAAGNNVATLRLQVTGSTAQVWYGSDTATTSLSTNLSGNRHGIGYAPSGIQESVLDNFFLDTLNDPPTAPTLTAPASSATVDRTITQRMAWNFTDPNSGDSQSQFDLQWRVNNAGATGAWQSVTGTTPNGFWDAPAATFPAGGVEWQVRTYDAAGVQGPWSPSFFFTAAIPPPGPTITAPVSGATMGANAAAVTWSIPAQDAWQVRQVADLSGSPPATPTVAQTYADTGPVSDAAARQAALTFPVNGRSEHVQVRVRSQGLWSVWSTVRVTVSYTPPPVPVVFLSPVQVIPEEGPTALQVAWTIPAPTGTQPAVTSVSVLVDDGAGLEQRAARLPAAGPWLHPTPVSGRDYSGRVRVVLVGANGTTSTATDIPAVVDHGDGTATLADAVDNGDGTATVTGTDPGGGVMTI